MKRKIIATILLVLVLMSCLSINTQAAYQIRPNYTGLKNKTASDFWYNIRLMETADGPMGLDMPVTEENIYKGYNNGIDVHMIKNSEWGAVAMLSASGYGAGKQTAQYSTDNYTGVHNLGYDGNWEYTTTFVTKDGTNVFNSNGYVSSLTSKGIDSRYYDLYYVGNDITNGSQYEKFYKYNYGSEATINHRGDAYYEVANLLTGYNKYHVYPSDPFFGRGSGGVFTSGTGNGNPYGSYGTRAVVVCGSGL